MLHLKGVSRLMKTTKNLKIVEEDTKSLKVQIIKGSNNKTTIPKLVSKELSYILAVIICDGHIRKDKYRLWLENINIIVIKKFVENIKFVFGIEATYHERPKRIGKKKSYIVAITNKPISILLNNIFEIPRGKKSHIVKVPELIKKSSLVIKKSFIEGVFDTDGGKRHNCLGLSSASKEFRDDLTDILIEFGFDVKNDEWINRKYFKKYYGLYFKNISGSPLAVNGAGLQFCKEL